MKCCIFRYLPEDIRLDIVAGVSYAVAGAKFTAVTTEFFLTPMCISFSPSAYLSAKNMKDVTVNDHQICRFPARLVFRFGIKTASYLARYRIHINPAEDRKERRAFLNSERKKGPVEQILRMLG